MSRVVPLIRACVLFPMFHRMQQDGRPLADRIAAAGLPQACASDPFAAVPLVGCVALFAGLARDGVPDLGCRAVTAESLREIAIISRVGLGAATPREAMLRIAAAMPYHCTHEHLTLGAESDAAVLRDRIAVPMDQDTRHLVQQYVAMMVRRICEMAGNDDLPLRQVVLTPHSVHGVAHLQPWLGPGVVARQTDTLAVTMAAAVADRPFPRPGRTRPPATGPQVAPLRGDGTLAASIRLILPALLDSATPTLDQVATAAGMSRRTLQRLLAQEGTSLSKLVEDTRRAEAMRRLTSEGGRLAALSSALGYSQQSALTRAVRRWTGKAPSRLRVERTG